MWLRDEAHETVVAQDGQVLREGPEEPVKTTQRYFSALLQWCAFVFSVAHLGLICFYKPLQLYLPIYINYYIKLQVEK
jgi:hypothetical protein